MRDPILRCPFGSSVSSKISKDIKASFKKEYKRKEKRLNSSEPKREFLKKGKEQVEIGHYWWTEPAYGCFCRQGNQEECYVGEAHLL